MKAARPAALPPGVARIARGPNRLVVALLAAIALWLVIAATLAQFIATADLRLAPAFLGINGRSKLTDVAAPLLRGDATPPEVVAARRAATVALLREPTNATAARTLALSRAVAGDAAGSRRAFEYVETVSRRDVPTEVALIEVYVAAGDVKSALIRYDRIMRTEIGMRPILAPILAEAASDPDIARSLAPLLARGPNWLQYYLLIAIKTASSAPALAIQLRAAHLSIDDAAQRLLLSGGLSAIVGLGAPDIAWRLYCQATGTAADQRQTIRDGDFEGRLPIAPFDWSLASTPERSPALEPQEGASGFALTLNATDKGELARQTLLLTPGHYVLEAKAGATDNVLAQPSLAIRCENGQQPLTVEIPAALPGGKTFRWPITVPPECPSQTVIISSGGGSGGQQVPWIDNLTIRSSPVR